MALPKDLGKIQTNLTREKLEEVARALDKKEVDWVPGTGFIHEYLGGGEFIYGREKYKMTELSETVKSINKV